MTMTEIVLPQAAPAPAAITPALPRTADVIQIAEWAAELAAARELATMLAHSNFLPMNLRMKGKNNFKSPDELVADGTAIILAGKSVGMDPMQSVQNIFPVHGQPSMYARSMQAIVIAAGHEVERSAATDTAVTVRARRKGSKEWKDYTWTIDRAKRAGYTSNPKYQSDPIGMLTAKALAEACRLTAPDVLLGMAYSKEELELEDLGETDQPQPAAPAAEEKPKRKVQRRPAANAAPAPSLPPVVNDAPEGTEAEQHEPDVVDTETGELPETATPGQIDALVTELNRAGHTTKAAKADAIEQVLGVRKSATQLTPEEAVELAMHFADEADGVVPDEAPATA
jgi:hypothetical protein